MSKALRFFVYAENDADPIAAFASYMDANDWCEGGDCAYFISDEHNSRKERFAHKRGTSARELFEWVTKR